MISTSQAQALMNGGGSVVAADGSNLGAIGVIFLDAVTGDPAWVSTPSWSGGAGGPVVPLIASSIVGDDIAVAFDRQQIADAPRIRDDGHLAPSEERALCDYYGIDARGQVDPEPTATPGGRPGTVDDGVMVRSEERLRLGTETVESGRVRVHKYIVTEEVTMTVQVSREEVRLEREPVNDLGTAPATRGAQVREQLVELTLHAQRPVVTLETVPVERVRVLTEVVTERVEVIDQVRKERIDAERSAAGVEDNAAS